MRADDIRAMVLEAHDRAIAVCERLSESELAREHEIADYRATLEATAEFWRTATPAFVFAWFSATAAEVGENGS